MLYWLGISSLCSPESVRHLRQCKHENDNELQFQSPLHGYGHHLRELTRKQDVDYMILFINEIS